MPSSPSCRNAVRALWFAGSLLATFECLHAQQQCDTVWDKARNYAESSGQESREYVYAKQMCSEKGRSRTAGESASLGATYAGYGLSFGSGSTTAEQFIDKACGFVNDAEKVARINISRLNQLASDAGTAYRACLGLFSKQLSATVRVSDPIAQQVLIGLVYNGGAETSVTGIPKRNFDCFVEPRKGRPQRAPANIVQYPLVVAGGGQWLTQSCL